jgi:internalin A
MLVIAIIASIGWYLFEYDRDFTRDQLVRLARRFEADGKQEWAIRLYDLAYEQSDKDEDVAIELAELFRDAGNYTKAEYTLSNAIADGGSLDLYIALCKTYVEQDKLLDAVNMLDNVSDPMIKEQLDSMRPAAPVATPEQGHYSEYRSVTFQKAQGTVYAATDGGYPSIADGPCTAPIPLPGGETIIYALTVGENGLVSPLQIFGYTIAGVIEEVTLTDSAIDRTVRELLQVDQNHALYSNELWTITSLIVPTDAESLNDLVWMPFLEQVTIRDSHIDTLEPLASLSNLTDLIIMDTPISSADLAFIADLANLKSLTLADCGLSGISELSGATGLTWLDLSDNTIGNVSALAGMAQLEYVDLSHNALTSLEVFQDKAQLSELYVSYNSISSTAPLSSCPALAVLDLNGNQLTSLDGLDSIPGLRSLSVAFNKLTDVSALASCTTLGMLDISNNQITDISSLSTLTQLLDLNFSYNQVTQLPAFSKGCALATVKGSSNLLKSMEELRGLKHLNYVFMDQNPNLTSVAPLAECYALLEVSVYGTSITDVSILTAPVDGKDRNIKVFYSPIQIS